MKTKIQISIFITFFLTTIFGLQAQNTYHPDDKEALRVFLRQPSAVPGQYNFQRCGMEPSDTLNWETSENWVTDIAETSSTDPADSCWNNEKPKRLQRLNWIERKLAGSFNLSACSALLRLDIYRNEITSLDVSGCIQLNYLFCGENKLSNLDLSTNTELKTLYCEHNQLTTLDLSGNTKLERVHCYNNPLTNLNTSNNKLLSELSCANAQLTSLNIVSDTVLWTLNCSNNQFTNLDVSTYVKLQFLDCSDNQISTLNVSNNPRLFYFNCENNLITALNLSKDTNLHQLICNNNKLTSLDLSKNTELTYLNCMNNYLKISTLLIKDISRFGNACFYSPQRRWDGGFVRFDTPIDLSSEFERNIDGDIKQTNFTWYHTTGGPEKIVTDSAHGNNGIFSFSENFVGKQLYCVMGNEHFPYFSVRYDVIITDGNSIPVVDVTLNKRNLQLKVDSMETLIAEIIPDNAANQNITWESRDENIATVDNTGLVTAIAEGKTYIVVTTDDFGHKDSCKVTVVTPTTSVILDKQILSLKADSMETLVATVNPTNATNQSIIWESLSTNIATVDNNGKVKAKDVGQTYIVATTQDGNFKDSCQVNVLSSYHSDDKEALRAFLRQPAPLDSTEIQSGQYTSCNAFKVGVTDTSNWSTSENWIRQISDLTWNNKNLKRLVEISWNERGIAGNLNIGGCVDLSELKCYSNLLTGLDISNNISLTYLRCSNNPLTTLDVSANTELNSLYCQNNQLNTLDLSANIKLTVLFCDYNMLTTLEVPASLQSLACNFNQLTALDLSPNTDLGLFWCENNKINHLILPEDATIHQLVCRNNQLKFSALPQRTSIVHYAPQDTIQGGNVAYSAGIDLSAEYNINDSITTFTWYDITTEIEIPITLQDNNGIFSLDNSYIGKTLRCKMLNGYFPQFTTAQPLVYEVAVTDGTDIAVTSVTLNEHTLSLDVDSTEILLATIVPNNATNQNITWESRDENIATVNNNGLVAAIAEGETYIVVTTADGGFKDSCLVTVEANVVAVTGTTLNKHAISLKVDSTETLLATITPNNATNQNVSWQSRDENIATVDNNGLVTAIAEGETYIVVTTTDGGFQDSCLVMVETNVGINIPKNQETTFKIYPNPTSGKLTIENENQTSQTAELFDLSGKLVTTFKISDKQTEIDISHLPNGTYLLKIGNTSTKVVKN